MDEIVKKLRRKTAIMRTLGSLWDQEKKLRRIKQPQAVSQYLPDYVA